MIAAIIDAAIGFVLGATVVAVIMRHRKGRGACPDPNEHELTSTDHDAISEEFATHAEAVRRELSRYADALADGDDHLREMLRRVEAGV